MNKTQKFSLSLLKDYTNPETYTVTLADGVAAKLSDAKESIAKTAKAMNCSGIEAAAFLTPEHRGNPGKQAYLLAAGAWYDLPRMLDMTGNAREARSLRTLRINGSTAADALERSALQKLLDHAKKMEL